MRLLLAFACVLLGATAIAANVPLKTIAKSQAGQAAYPEWAHHHWVWLARSNNTQENQIEWLDSWIAHDIPVGALDIDSLWAQGVNNFVWNKDRFPDPVGMMQYFKSKGVRIILWITSVVDVDSPNYQEGLLNNYYLNNGTIFKWWHGWGSFIDYTNPNAVNWWHKQMDAVLNIGVDGWKCDGTDPYVMEFVQPHGYRGPIGYHEYGHMYYRDFLYHSRSINPDALIMSRPVDSAGPLYWNFSPHDVMLSGWVGDQQGNWAGLQHAMNNMIESALQKYANFGSDIGGYLVTKNRELIVFVRWFQMGAFVPLMENGGNDEHRPWMWDQPGSTTILDTYRKFVHTHMELLPYLLNAGTTALSTNVSVLKPIAKSVLTTHSWDYWLWHDIFISPIVESPGNIKTVSFPSGNNYINYWDATKTYTGGSTLALNVSITEFPAFQRAGSIIPLEVQSSVTNHGLSSEHITAMIVPTRSNSPTTATVRRWKEDPIELSYLWPTGGNLQFQSTSHRRGIIVLLRGVISCPISIIDEIYGNDIKSALSLEEMHQMGSGHFCDLGSGQTFIHLGVSSPHGTSITVKGLKTFLSH